MLFEGGYTFSNFLANALAVFLFVVWFWLLIVVFSDLFRRQDISGWGKALWVIGLLVFLVPWLVRVHDHPRKGHGGAKRPASSAGAR